MAQPDFLPVELALESLPPAPPMTTQGVPDREQRALFLSLVQSHFAQADGWLRELTLALAPKLGGGELVFWLIDLATTGSQAERALALEALASITGWDARIDDAGNPRSTDRAAKAYAEECRKPA